MRLRSTPPVSRPRAFPARLPVAETAGIRAGAERQAARKEKNFARADEIRDQLLEQGIVLKDTREGVKWSRA